MPRTTPVWRFIRIGAAVFLSVALLTPREVWPMDCSKAKSKAEQAVCGSPELLALDAKLNKAYAKLRAALKPGEREKLSGMQKRWMEDRDKLAVRLEGNRAQLAELLKYRMNERIQVLASLATATQGKPVTIGSFTVCYRYDTKWDVSYPILVSGPKGVNVEALKALLENAGLESCECGEAGADTSGYENYSRSEVVYADREFLTVKHAYEADCGGAYPSHGTDLTTYRVETGKTLSIQGCFKDTFTADKAVQIAKASDPELEKQAEDCGLEDLEIGSFGVAVVQNAVVLHHGEGEANRPCDADLKLPLGKLKPFIAKDGPLAGLLKRQTLKR